VFSNIIRVLRGGKRRKLIPAITFLSKKEKKKHKSKIRILLQLENIMDTFPLVSRINGVHGRL
jgi:hypothetical protein